jgi:hypothetical protein
LLPPALLSLALATGLIGPPRVQPDIARGEALFAAHCASCHAGAFRDRAWREERTPEWAASVAHGLAGSHPAVAQDAAQAWHVTAYVWTRSSPPYVLQRGLALAEEGKQHIERQSAMHLLMTMPHLRRLQDPAWVLARPERDVRDKAALLAGERFADLSEAERRALVDYIYASFFVWPEEWLAGR